MVILMMMEEMIDEDGRDARCGRNGVYGVVVVIVANGGDGDSYSRDSVGDGKYGNIEDTDIVVAVCCHVPQHRCFCSRYILAEISGCYRELVTMSDQGK